MFRINNIKIRKDISNEEVLKIAIEKNHINKNDIIEWHISKKSIDARKKEDIFYLYSIDLKLKNEKKYRKIEKIKEFTMPNIKTIQQTDTNIVIVGSGPAGLFAAITLVQNGFKPTIIEQGQCVDERKKTIDHFQKSGKLNTFSNVQFGEGGAGTFSDGKLTTGINSPFCKKVLQEFVHFGAPEEILYISKPHIGTDNLINIIKNMRNYIISKGGKFLFNTKVIDFNIQNNKINYLVAQDVLNKNTYEIKATSVILAIGHSSRDTFEKLYTKRI